MPSNTRPLGEVGRLTLSFIIHVREKTRTLFLGPGAGRECFDARAIAERHNRTLEVTTVALTPVAPDLAVWEKAEDSILKVPPFIDTQLIGNFHELDLQRVRPNWIYDQFGPLFHGSAKTDVHKTNGVPTVAHYREMLQKLMACSAPTSCIVQEYVNNDDHSQCWKDMAGPNDVLFQCHRSSVLLRQALPFIQTKRGASSIQRFRDIVAFEDALRATLKQLYKRTSLIA